MIAHAIDTFDLRMRCALIIENFLGKGFLSYFFDMIWILGVVCGSDTRRYGRDERGRIACDLGS